MDARQADPQKCTCILVNSPPLLFPEFSRINSYEYNEFFFQKSTSPVKLCFFNVLLFCLFYRYIVRTTGGYRFARWTEYNQHTGDVRISELWDKARCPRADELIYTETEHVRPILSLSFLKKFKQRIVCRQRFTNNISVLCALDYFTKIIDTPPKNIAKQCDERMRIRYDERRTTRTNVHQINQLSTWQRQLWLEWTDWTLRSEQRRQEWIKIELNVTISIKKFYTQFSVLLVIFYHTLLQTRFQD